MTTERTDAEWDELLTIADDLVAKGYSVVTPRWVITPTLRGWLREAIAQKNDRACDRLTFALDEWLRKP